MKKQRKTRAVWAALLIAALVFAGCAGKTPAAENKEAPAAAERADDGANRQTATESETAQISENPVRPTEKTVKTPINEPMQPTEAAQAETEPCVRAQWAEDVMTDLSEYERSVWGMDDEPAPICFSAERTVENFCLLSVSMASIDEDGNIAFIIENADNRGTMTTDDLFIARPEFMGTIPNNGICYDENGVTRYFTLDVSGYDGSLLLTEFTPAQ